MPDPADLRIGLVGAGFIARFHLTALLGVRRARRALIESFIPALAGPAEPPV